MKALRCEAYGPHGLKSRIDGHHVFPRRTAEPKDISDVRSCRHCGAKQVAGMTPPRAKKRLKWYWK